MKKISIFATSLLIIGFAVFIPNSSINAKNRPNYVKTKDRIEVAFTNEFTFDSLVYIKNDLKIKGIIINYKKIEFDETNKLLSIDCEIDCKDGFKGSFVEGLLNSTNKNKRFGFYRDYSNKSKSPFGTGYIGD
jgi:hypothetical protein